MPPVDHTWLDFFAKKYLRKRRKNNNNDDKSIVAKGSKQEGSEQANCNFFVQEFFHLQMR